MTRLAQFYSGSEKRYKGTIRLGFATDTYDADGDAGRAAQKVQVSLEEFAWAVRRFVGPHSAGSAAVFGQEDPGRSGLQAGAKNKQVELQAVEVEIKELTVLR